MDVGGGGSNEGRVSSLERPPPPPHSHSVAHNVGNLLHMAGSFPFLRVSKISYDLLYLCSVIKMKSAMSNVSYARPRLCFKNNNAFLFFFSRHRMDVR